MKWLRENLFSSWPNAIATLVVALILFIAVPPFFDWAFLHAV